MKITDVEIRSVEARIKDEMFFHPVSEWHSPPGGREGRYIWGWHTEAPGAGMIVNFGEAERGLYQEVIEAFRIYTRIFEVNGCKTEICTVRRLAIIDMIFDLGEIKFGKMVRFLNRVFNDDWTGAAYELRQTIWYTAAPVGRRERRIAREIEEGTSDYPLPP